MRILITCPHYTEQISVLTSQAIYLHAIKPEGSRHEVVDVVDSQSSLLARSFNQLWCYGLTLHDKGQIDAIAMLHADIGPGPMWLEKLADTMEQHQANVVSAVVPIKNGEGKTSTAIGDPETPWGCLRHITPTDLLKLPDVFTAADCGEPGKDLLINTGCMLVKIGEWCKPPRWSGFEIRDRIILGENGYEFQTAPEDWNFSRHAARYGCKVLAMKFPGLRHYGTASWEIR